MFRVSVNLDSALRNIEEVLVSGYINEGIQVTHFQRALSQLLGVENLVLMNSCTSALTVAYRLAGVEPGTEVISTPMTCVATNTPVLNLGGHIVWADIDPNTGNIRSDQLESLITPRTKAIAYVDWAGNPAELDQIQNVGRRFGVKVIQDAAHAFGAMWGDKSIAHFADFTCFSFQAIKHLSTGDGGALICQNDDDFVLARKLKWFGYDRDSTKDEKGEWKGQRWDADILINEVGYKFNLNNVSAALGLAALENIGEILSRHRENAATIEASLREFPWLTPLAIPAKAVSSFWVYTVLLHVDIASKRDQIIELLNIAGVAAGLVHLPNDTYSAFDSSKTELPGVREFESRQLSIPCGWWLTKDDVMEVIEITKSIVSRFI